MPSAFTLTLYELSGLSVAGFLPGANSSTLTVNSVLCGNGLEKDATSFSSENEPRDTPVPVPPPPHSCRTLLVMASRPW